MEVLQLLKSIFRDNRLDFSEAWATQMGERDESTVNIGEGVLRELVTAGRLNELEAMIKAAETN